MTSVEEQKTGTFLSANWSDLIMINYEVTPELLTDYLPVGTELDYFDNTTYLSLVGFLFKNTRVLGMKVPYHQHFEEVNLRFYVKRRVGKEWRRGVVFIKEIVPKRMIAAVANTIYKEHYVCLPMRHNIEANGQRKVQYEWKAGEQWNSFKVIADLNSQPMVEGSEAEFIAEHYWGYTQVNSRKTSEYQVEHPRWDIHPVKEYSINCNFDVLYGEAIAEAMSQQPKSAMLAQGSDIIVRKGTYIKENFNDS